MHGNLKVSVVAEVKMLPAAATYLTRAHFPPIFFNKNKNEKKENVQ